MDPWTSSQAFPARSKGTVREANLLPLPPCRPLLGNTVLATSTWTREGRTNLMKKQRVVEHMVISTWTGDC
jgi:hypothetical protein